jgi:anti-sigma B factor antagonist
MRCATMRRPRLLIDCGSLPCLRTHGVAHLASYLLLLHQTGAKLRLYNVSPSLHYMLYLLRLDTVFRVYPPKYAC